MTMMLARGKWAFHLFSHASRLSAGGATEMLVLASQGVGVVLCACLRWLRVPRRYAAIEPSMELAPATAL
jgi:hypothetical protein